jgi:PAS domain S-box-containing protein
MDNSGTILIVDDQQRGRMALASLLEPEGYRVVYAENGPEALAQTAGLRPDLVLLDVMMPDMDGFEVCRRLRADPHTAEVPLMMVTALDDQESLLRGIEAGADDFVTKPFNRAELRARVRTITRLNRYRSLWESRSRYEQLIEHSPNGVMIIDAQGAILLANPALLHLLAAKAAQPPLSHIDQVVAPERQAEAHARLQALFAGHENDVRFETTLVASDGLRRPVEADAGLCEWGAGAAAQVLIRDVTDRRRAELLEEERRQTAYDLHDGVAQVITGVYQHLQLFARRHRPQSDQARAALDQIQAMAQRAVAETRRVIEGLRPTALDDFGLAGALEMLAESLRNEGWSLSADLRLSGERLPPPLETALFRIAQEALTNTHKYAGETRAALTLTRSADVVRLEVRDWGVGFDPATLAGPAGLGEQLGLRAMRDRAALLGGELQIDARPGHGVSIVATIPLTGAGQTGARNDE